MDKSDSWKLKIEKQQKIHLARDLVQIGISYSEIREILREIFESSVSDATLSKFHKEKINVKFNSEEERKIHILTEVNQILKQKVRDQRYEITILQKAFEILQNTTNKKINNFK